MTDAPDAPEYEIHPDHLDPDGPHLATADEDGDPLSLAGDVMPEESE